MEELPPGFRFYPTEEELISFYLHHKLQGSRPELDRVIPVVDIYSHEPWELPKVAGKNDDVEQWFFFTAQQEREARGGKPSRTTASGYWKATGSPGYVYCTTQKRGIGVKKTMVFYKGRAPVGMKTPWKMNEYKAIHIIAPPASSSSSHAPPPIPKLRHEMSVCRVYITSGSSRAFDRRPFGAITNTIEAAATLQPRPPPHHQQPLQLQSADHHHLTTTTTPTAMTTSAVPMEKSSSSSSDSSRSGGGRESSNNTNYMNDEEMITSGLQPLWEWEQLNWP